MPPDYSHPFTCMVGQHTLFSNGYIVYQNRNPNHIAQIFECGAIAKKNRFAQTKRSKRVLQLEISIFIRSSIKILINQAEYVHNSDTYILDTIDPINLRAVYVPRNPSSRILRIIACIETCTTCVCVCG